MKKILEKSGDFCQRKKVGTLTGVPPPQKGHGTSESIMGLRWGTPPPGKDMGPVEVLWEGDGINHPPPTGFYQTDTCEDITSRRTM